MCVKKFLLNKRYNEPKTRARYKNVSLCNHHSLLYIKILKSRKFPLQYTQMGYIIAIVERKIRGETHGRKERMLSLSQDERAF